MAKDSPKTNRIVQQKKRLLEALEKRYGVVTYACNDVGLARTTFYEYYKNDEDFKDAVDSIEGVAVDFAESKLLENIDKGDTTAMIFYLKTRGKKRGFVEKQEVDHTSKGEKVNFGVQITMPSNGREVD